MLFIFFLLLAPYHPIDTADNLTHYYCSYWNSNHFLCSLPPTTRLRLRLSISVDFLSLLSNCFLQIPSTIFAIELTGRPFFATISSPLISYTLFSLSFFSISIISRSIVRTLIKPVRPCMGKMRGEKESTFTTTTADTRFGSSSLVCVCCMGRRHRWLWAYVPQHTQSNFLAWSFFHFNFQ